MTLTPEQKQTVAAWVAAGDNLSSVQKKLVEHFKVSLTYMDVRFLVDDLNLALKDAAPKADANDVSKAQPVRPEAEKPGDKKDSFDKTREKSGTGVDDPKTVPEDAELVDEELPEEEELPAGASNISVAVDKLVLHPGAVASGTVTFSDGVTGKWVVDNYGRPGFTEVSKPGYRPSPADAQAFMRELNTALQRRGY